MASSLRWYLISTAFFLIPGGLQSVLYPWLVAVHLHESPARVGFAQMAGQLPMVLLILFGGLLGDRVDQRSLLIRLHLLMMLPPLCMASLFAAEYISYELLIGWAVVGGVLASFVGPTRDAMLSKVAGRDVQRIVMLVTAVQFGVQIVGFGLGSLADRVGPIVLLCVQAVSMGLCAWGTAMIAKVAPPGVSATPATAQTQSIAAQLQRMLNDIGEGIAIAWRSPSIRGAIALSLAVGVFFAGAYVVVLPLMVRDLYDGGATGIALVFAMNMLGTVLTIFVLMFRGGIDRPGRALILGSGVSCFVLSLLHFELPIWAFYGVSLIWGMCGGISMTMSRAIVQEAAPSSHRARLMSVYSLGMIGGMPVGSAVLGWCVGEYGARDAVLVPVFGMACVVLLLLTGTRLWSVRRNLPVALGAAAS